MIRSTHCQNAQSAVLDVFALAESSAERHEDQLPLQSGQRSALLFQYLRCIT